MVPAGRPQWRKSSYSTNGGENCVEVAPWRKSSYSGNGENCVEVAPWRKSSYSGNGGENCVEVASVPNLMLVRDSKHPNAGTIEFPLPAWAVFVAGAGDH